MSRTDSNTIISILWLIASLLEPSMGFKITCTAGFAIYSIRAAYFGFADRKLKP